MDTYRQMGAHTTTHTQGPTNTDTHHNTGSWSEQPIRVVLRTIMTPSLHTLLYIYIYIYLVLVVVNRLSVCFHLFFVAICCSALFIYFFLIYSFTHMRPPTDVVVPLFYLFICLLKHASPGSHCGPHCPMASPSLEAICQCLHEECGRIYLSLRALLAVWLIKIMMGKICARCSRRTQSRPKGSTQWIPCRMSREMEYNNNEQDLNAIYVKMYKKPFYFQQPLVSTQMA